MRPEDPRPPRLARLLLRAFSAGREAEAVDGDLLEAYRAGLAAGGDPARLRRWYRAQVARSLWPLATVAVRPRTLPSLIPAVLLGASVAWIPHVAAALLDPMGRMGISYEAVLMTNLVAAALLAPVGGRLATDLARSCGVAAPLGVAALLLFPALASIWLLPGAQPLWARCAWILLVPATAVAGGSHRARRAGVR